MNDLARSRRKIRCREIPKEANQPLSVRFQKFQLWNHTCAAHYVLFVVHLPLNAVCSTKNASVTVPGEA